MSAGIHRLGSNGYPEPQRALIIHEDTAIEAVVGYRAWRLSFVDGQAHLNSMYATESWPRRQALKAVCMQFAEVRPYGGHNPDCKCGIYSFRDPQRLGAEIWSLPPPSRRAPSVFPERGGYVVAGEVYMWGRIHVHQRGYRAEHAKIACLYPEFLPHEYGYARMNVARAAAASRTGIELAALQFEVPLVRVHNP